MKKEPKLTGYAKHRHEVEPLEREIEFLKGKISMIFEMISQSDGGKLPKAVTFQTDDLINLQHGFLEKIGELETDIHNRYMKYSESPRHWSNRKPKNGE